MKLPAKSPESELIKCQVSDYDGGGGKVSILSKFQYLKQTQNIKHINTFLTDKLESHKHTHGGHTSGADTVWP